MIGLCDCNNFYVSCERLFNPALEGRAVVVMSSNDGCVIARSNEAKALGIAMGQPLFQLREVIRQHNVVALSANLQLYGDISERVMTTLAAHIPSIEVYSIDEAFLDFEGFELSELETYGRNLSRIIRRSVGIPVSIGIAPSKTLAKVASKLCKAYPKLNGCCLMYREEDVKKVLTKFPIGDVWGIGRRSVAMLSEYNIRTAEQFRSAPKEWVKAKMGIVGLRTWRELYGESCIEIDSNSAERQSIMVSRSFQSDEHDVERLVSTIASFATRAVEKLRRQGSVAAQLEVFIATNRHRTDLPQHIERRGMNFATPTDSAIEVVSRATELLRAIYRQGYGYKRAGVLLSDISNNTGVQSSMFDTIDRGKHKSLMDSMDRLNAQMGRSTIKIGSQGDSISHSSCEHRSPLYTTEWSDILVVKV